jgi:hypothetical protein
LEGEGQPRYIPESEEYDEQLRRDLNQRLSSYHEKTGNRFAELVASKRSLDMLKLVTILKRKPDTEWE